MATATESKSRNGKSASQATTVEDLSDQIAILKDDVAALTATLGEVGKDKANAAKSNAQTAAKDAAETARLKAIETQVKAEDFLKDQPATALGIAAGLGFLVGLITARR